MLAQHSLFRPTHDLSSQFLQVLTEQPAFGSQLKAPSVSMGETPLFMRGAFESLTRSNLSKPMSVLVPHSNTLLHVNDKNLNYTLRIKLLYDTA